MSKETTMVTYTGRGFDMLNPRPEDICIEDIAHALALTNRYRGHTTRPYSVAEHCVRMASLGIGDPLICLLHDAAEAYIGDQSSPQKKLMWFCDDVPGVIISFSQEEHRILDCIGRVLGVFNLGYKAKDPGINKADGIMYLTEIRDLMPRSDFFDLYYKGLKSAPMNLRNPWDWADAERFYLDRYKELTHGKS